MRIYFYEQFGIDNKLSIIFSYKLKYAHSCFSVLIFMLYVNLTENPEVSGWGM